MTDDLPRTLLDIARAGMAPEATQAMIDARLRRLRPEGECKTCDAYRGETMFPSHTASVNCESGKRPHCTCSACF